MPVILEPDKEQEWLDTSCPLNDSLKLLKPLDQNLMRAHTISRLITQKGVDKNTPLLIKPYDYKDPSLI
jgi:putative SOS response-associated peptidase YedK